MLLSLPSLQVGQPVRHQALTVFPLFGGADAAVEYQLADEAISAGTLTVQEIGTQGTVPELHVENRGDRRVLFLEGEELRGAKQNRILNTSILIPAHAPTRIPVSCVEQGRWRHTSTHFSSAQTRSPHALHYKLKASVTRSLRERGDHRSDQGEVWQEVARTQATFGVSSPTVALADTFTNLEDRMREYRQRLAYCAGAVGVAVAVGGRVVSVDLFDQAATCQKAWERLLSGHMVDALEAAASGQAEDSAVELLLAGAAAASWDAAQTVGEGTEWRTVFNGCQGSALQWNQAIVHLNVLTPPA